MIRRLVVFGIAILAASGSLTAGVASPDEEPRITLEGRYEPLVADDFASGRSWREPTLVTSQGEHLRLLFPDEPTHQRIPGEWIRISGWTEGSSFHVETTERIALPGTEAIASSWTTGPKRVLLIRFNFSNDTSQPYSDSTAQTVLFGSSGSVAAFYTEGSYGLTTQSGAITPWLTVSSSKPTTCDPFTPSNQANALATAAGFNPSNYDFQVYVFPAISSCGWAGLANVGAPGAWINQSLSPFVVSHELGHNYGLEHAHSLSCGASTIGTACNRSEYGDPFDTMGGGLHQFNAYAKSALGWLPPTGVATISGGVGTFNLSPLESPSGTRAVQVLTASGRAYWLEFRQAVGFDASLAGNANVMNGALLHIGPSDVGGTDLLDATAATKTFADAALDVGSSFLDPFENVQVTTVSKSGGSLTVTVQFGVVAPVASFTFLPASPVAGHAVSFTDTSTAIPTAWHWDFGDATTSALQNPAHTYSAPGVFTVTLVASNAEGSSPPAGKSLTVAANSATKFYTLTPCRVFDTRKAFGVYGGPALFANATRTFPLTGRCGIPAGAVAVSGNLAVTQPSAKGFLTLFADGTPKPPTASINFQAGQTRANNTVFPVSAAGVLDVHTTLGFGSVQAILDVNGYFE